MRGNERDGIRLGETARDERFVIIATERGQLLSGFGRRDRRKRRAADLRQHRSEVGHVVIRHGALRGVLSGPASAAPSPGAHQGVRGRGLPPRSTTMPRHFPCRKRITLRAPRIAWPARIATQMSIGSSVPVSLITKQIPSGTMICEMMEM